MTLIIQKPTVIPPSLMVLFRSTLLTWPMHAWFWPPLITWNYLTGKKGKSVQITKPILRVEVDKQRKLNPGTLKLWDKVWHKCGISVQETSPESGYDQSHSWSSSGSGWRIIEGCGWSSANKAKKKLRQCTYCVRSFTEEEKLVQNINVEHYMDKSFDPHLCLCWRWPWPSVIQ